jgi:hypothetical protein
MLRSLLARRGISLNHSPSGGDGVKRLMMRDEPEAVRACQPRLVLNNLGVEFDQFDDHVGQLRLERLERVRASRQPRHIAVEDIPASRFRIVIRADSPLGHASQISRVRAAGKVEGLLRALRVLRVKNCERRRGGRPGNLAHAKNAKVGKRRI